MRYSKIFKLILFICVIFSVSKIKVVKAEECTTQEKNKLIQYANNIKFDYELFKDESSGKKLRYYKITISNLSPGIYIAYNGFKYGYDENSKTPEMAKLVHIFSTSEIYSFDVYGSEDTVCNGQVITTVTITTPPYNIYSERKECQKYPDFKLCDKNYEAEITDERFELELKKYIISVDGEEKKEEVKDEKADFISKFLRAYKSNLVLSILLTIALFGGIGVLIYYFVIKRRKNNVDTSCK